MTNIIDELSRLDQRTSIGTHEHFILSESMEKIRRLRADRKVLVDAIKTLKTFEYGESLTDTNWARLVKVRDSLKVLSLPVDE